MRALELLDERSQKAPQLLIAEAFDFVGRSVALRRRLGARCPVPVLLLFLGEPCDPEVRPH